MLELEIKSSPTRVCWSGGMPNDFVGIAGDFMGNMFGFRRVPMDSARPDDLRVEIFVADEGRIAAGRCFIRRVARVFVEREKRLETQSGCYTRTAANAGRLASGVGVLNLSQTDLRKASRSVGGTRCSCGCGCRRFRCRHWRGNILVVDKAKAGRLPAHRQMPKAHR